MKYFIRPDGGVTILPVMPAIALAGFLKRKGPTITLDDMDKAIAEGAARAPLPRR